MNLYEQFSGEQLKIAALIKQRRLQMLIHSYLYYEMDCNIVSDQTWAKWAKELQQLQNDYPELSNKIDWSEEFEGWDGSSGAYLPLNDAWVINKAKQIWYIKEGSKMNVKFVPDKKPKPKKETNQKTLF